ncbi:MAG TPA: Gfo/Idh/MocA family oxidoreductase [Terrimicrobiaceae bacterium]
MSLPPIRVGFAGYGKFAQFLTKAWGSLEGVEVVAAASLHEEPKDLRLYKHYDGLLKDEEVDLVAITAPPNLHAAIAGSAMEAGKHVIIEKPVATALEDAKRLLETRDGTGRVAGVNFMMRFTPLAEIFARWKEERPFGKLWRAVIENHAQDETLPMEHWFWDTARSGGILVEHAGHFFDLINSFTNANPGRVGGWSHRRSSGTQDRMLATVAYDDGLTASHYHTFSRPGFFERTTIRLWFDLAEIQLEGWIPISGKIYALTTAATEPALAILPHFQETERRTIAERTNSLPRNVTISGESFSVADEIEGNFEIGRSKMEVYTEAACAMLMDVRRGIADPNHKLRVPLEFGVEALRIAIEASDDAAKA